MMRKTVISFFVVLIIQLTEGKILFAQSTRTEENQRAIMTDEKNNMTGKFNIISKDGTIKIPFEFYRNKFRFKAQINGKECKMMLDNGSLWDELLFFGSSSVDSIGFKYSRETSLGLNKADVSTDVTMGFDDVIFSDQTAIVTRYDPRLPNVWEGTDGQVSAAFFKNFVVIINFDKSEIELISPGKFHYTGNGQELMMKPGPFKSILVPADIIIQNDTETKIDLLIDLGGFYPLYLPVGKDDRIVLPSKTIETTLGTGLQIQKGYAGRIKSIHLGKYSLENVLTAFTLTGKEKNEYGNTMIGLPLLQRFNVIFDYFNNRLIIEPSKYFNKQFKFNMTGLELLPDINGNLKVIKIYPDSPAVDSQIEVNDIITKVNDKPVSDYKPGEIREILMKEGEYVYLDILRTGQVRKIKIKLQEIL